MVNTYSIATRQRARGVHRFAERGFIEMHSGDEPSSSDPSFNADRVSPQGERSPPTDEGASAEAGGEGDPPAPHDAAGAGGVDASAIGSNFNPQSPSTNQQEKSTSREDSLNESTTDDSTLPGSTIDETGALIPLPDEDGLVHAESQPEENPGDRIVTWFVDHRAYSFDRDAQERFLRALMKHGRFTAACGEAGVAISTMAFHRRRNPDFARAVEDCLAYWKDRIEEEIQRRAMEGWDEPVFGGQFKDEVVGHIRRYDSRLLELLAKRHIPEYRDKQEVAHNHSGGVLVVPGNSPVSIEQLKEMQMSALLPTAPPTFGAPASAASPGPVIDVETSRGEGDGQ